MNIFGDKKKRKSLIWATSLKLVLALLVGGSLIYVSDYYRADMTAIEAFSFVGDFEEINLDGGDIAFVPKDAVAGFIFYPGGKVEYTAYLPLMRSLAGKGILCVLTKMPCNLAVLDMNAADGIRELYPELTDWYIGGHSLGGSMAASYVDKNADSFRGLVLLGAYSTADLSDTELSALSLYGSEDKIMNREKYEKYKSNLPEKLTEAEFFGFCHAYFGVYGKQKGDGEPTVTNREQIAITSNTIYEFILRSKADAENN